MLHEVIPAIDKLTAFLDKIASNVSLPLGVRAAALNGLKILNKYYAKTDESIMYRAAMGMFLLLINLHSTDHPPVLHPKKKLEYFRENGWLPDWIAKAREVVEELWKEYKPDEQLSGPVNEVCRTRMSFSALANSFQAPVGDIESLFDDPKPRAARVKDALAEYLDQDPIETDDPIGYWHALLSTPRQAPLARMALDVLSAPGL